MSHRIIKQTKWSGKTKGVPEWSALTVQTMDAAADGDAGEQPTPGTPPQPITVSSNLFTRPRANIFVGKPTRIALPKMAAGDTNERTEEEYL